jgi:exopolysaccharide biosynthesis WecB/TagA/CpsF family protein
MKLEDVVHTNVGGLRTACVTRRELVELMENRIIEFFDESSQFYCKPMTVFSANGHSISIANSDKQQIMEIFNQADILHADGQSVVSFSKWFSEIAIPERSATTDTIHDFPTLIREPKRHFLLGSEQKTVEQAASIMGSKYQNFIVCGSQNGYFDKADELGVIEKINAAAPHILWVALGKPKEQYFIARNKDKLNVPVIISCGGCFHFITGDYSRAPKWMQEAGLEWFYRAATQPKKLLWRYLTTNPHAIFCVLKHRYFSSC